MPAKYDVEILNLVNNPHCIFYKLTIDGKCGFDEFLRSIENNISAQKNLKSIIAYMDRLDAMLLSAKTYNSIKIKGRSDIREFKKNDVRVYVADQKPYIYVIMGGFKKNQKRDIERLSIKIKDFPNPFK